MRHMKRSCVEPWIENVGETGGLEPAFKQNTNDDEMEFNFISEITFKLIKKLSLLCFTL